MTRRDWIASLAAVAPLAGSAWAKTGASASGKVGLSRLSAISDEIATAPEGALEFARMYHLQWLELRNVPGRSIEYARLEEPELKQAAKEFKDNGIRISFLNTGMLKFGLPGSDVKVNGPETAEQAKRNAREQTRFDERMKYLDQSIRAAHILDLTNVRVFAFSRTTEPEKHYPRIAEIIGEMANVAAREGIKLLIENETSCNAATCEEAASLLKMIPSKDVGLNWDVLNGVDMGEPAFPHGYSLLPKHRIWNVQAKGKSLLEADKLQDWQGIIRALAKDDYTGCIGLENHMFGRMHITQAHYEIREMIRVAATA
ncbi:MAG TPA: TIM barrel protein [Bryobacteraceae bacterium]|jgi:sugar phosphate isomerase/epimerase